MSKLVICEKPSVAKSIASALGVTSRADGYFEGGGWLISWCIGHLVGLADAAAYDDRYKKWRYEDLPILPAPFHYVVSEEKADQFHILRSLMERPDVTELVNACDAGREGELIFRLVYEAAGCSKPFSRLWISSMEDAAIREGFADLHPGADYDPLYQSALCRQKADWLIGINASRLFSVLYHRTLNIGRVQTPTLAMLADRDSNQDLAKRQKTLADAEKRIAELDTIFKRLYEDTISGKLSDERFQKLSTDYEKEQHQLQDVAAALRDEIEAEEQKSANVERFLSVVERYTEIPELTPCILHEFVEKIVVHAASDPKGKNRTQEIDIYYKGIGALEVSKVTSSRQE